MGLKLVRIGDHKGSSLPCYGFASRGMHRGKGTFLHPEISLSVSFANNEPCAAGAPPRMKLILPYPNFRGSAMALRVRGEHEKLGISCITILFPAIFGGKSSMDRTSPMNVMI